MWPALGMASALWAGQATRLSTTLLQSSSNFVAGRGDQWQYLRFRVFCQQQPRCTRGSRSLAEVAEAGGGIPSEGARTLHIIHFNDVYQIEPRTVEPVGGAARFSTAVKAFQHRSPLLLFSGDCLNPSLMSAFTCGEQMVPVLNALGVQCAVTGNHGEYGCEGCMCVGWGGGGKEEGMESGMEQQSVCCLPPSLPRPLASSCGPHGPWRRFRFR
jgi:hypothetical protein